MHLVHLHFQDVCILIISNIFPVNVTASLILDAGLQAQAEGRARWTHCENK